MFFATLFGHFRPIAVKSCSQARAPLLDLPDRATNSRISVRMSLRSHICGISCFRDTFARKPDRSKDMAVRKAGRITEKV